MNGRDCNRQHEDIAATEIGTILQLLTNKPYITQEVPRSDADVIEPNEYIGNGTFLDERCSHALIDSVD